MLGFGGDKTNKKAKLRDRDNPSRPLASHLTGAFPGTPFLTLTMAAPPKSTQHAIFLLCVPSSRVNKDSENVAAQTNSSMKVRILL